MQRPFNIFPSEGYKNSQFQVLATKEDIKIEIFYKGESKLELFTLEESSVLIRKLSEPGTYTVKCIYNNVEFEQEITVRDAFRLGSSKFKKAFVFENSDYSFFLMKDRLLLYNEAKGILLTENHYSPTLIQQIDKTKFLFVTKIGTESSGIDNVGIYDTEMFSITGELLNDYQSIEISAETNKAWLFKKSSKSIHCYELVSKKGDVFTEIRCFENVKDYKYYAERAVISITQDEKIIFTDITSLDKVVQVSKTPQNAIDYLGNNLQFNGDRLICTNVLDGYEVKVDYFDELYLADSDYLHLGSALKNKSAFSDLSEEANKIKEGIIASLPENKTYYNHYFPKSEMSEETITQHKVFPTINGLFILKQNSIRRFVGIKVKKQEGVWSETPLERKHDEFSLNYIDVEGSQTKIESTSSFNIVDYNAHCLITKSKNKTYVFRGKHQKIFSNHYTLSFKIVNRSAYLFVKDEHDVSTVFETSNLERPVLNKVCIMNLGSIKSHKLIWYTARVAPTHFNALDLSNNVRIRPISVAEYEFNQGYILSPNGFLINPHNGSIKGSIVGKIDSTSLELNKVVSHRLNHIYLSIYDDVSGKYQEREINIEINNFKESYLSPNGQFLVLQNQNNKYLWYDIEQNETVQFFSGNFLSFSKEGNLIIEEDQTKSVKIIDPLTFSDITPANYHHYRFTSPDGKLYSQVAMKTTYYDLVLNQDINSKDYHRYVNLFNGPSSYAMSDEDSIKQRLNENRTKYFNKNESALRNLGVKSYSDLRAKSIIRVEKLLEIGIVGTDKFIEVELPEDTDFFNYASFSYDNRYLGIVGKPLMGSKNKSLVILCSLSFDEKNCSLAITNSKIFREPKAAVWLCGFSATGYFAAYDSKPNTYLAKIDNKILESQITELELRNNVNASNTNIFNQNDQWAVISGKNFLCFSPTGKYLALSEQGYDPITLGGYGHQESGALHLASTKTGRLKCSFNDHGSNLVNPAAKDTIFVAFSEDEKKLMSMSKDGVVIVRDLNIDKSVPDSQAEVTPVYEDKVNLVL